MCVVVVTPTGTTSSGVVTLVTWVTRMVMGPRLSTAWAQPAVMPGPGAALL